MAFVCSMHHRRPFYEQVGQEIKLTSMNSRQIHTSKRLRFRLSLGNSEIS
jgi:hypothetical protein